MSQIYLKLSQISQSEYLGRVVSEQEVNPLSLCAFAMSRPNKNQVLLGKVLRFNQTQEDFEIRVRLFNHSEHGYSNTTSWTALACVFNRFFKEKVQLRPPGGYTASEADDGTFTSLEALLQDLEDGLLLPEVAKIESERLKAKHGVKIETVMEAL